MFSQKSPRIKNTWSKNENSLVKSHLEVRQSKRDGFGVNNP